MELVNYSIELILIVFVVAIVAGLLDTLAGGGGLITIPALMLTGMPPLSALATNKLQGSMGTATATILLFKSKKITWQKSKAIMFTAFIGAILGTFCVQLIDTQLLTIFIPSVLVIIAIYFIISPQVSADSKLVEPYYKNLIVPLIGFYDGMFGPGTGSFFAMAGRACRALPIVDSIAQAKPLNFATNVASLFVFIASGHVVWLIGGIMMVGQLIGSWLGTHCLFKINPNYLRWLVVIMCISMLLKYLLAMT